MSLDDFFGEGCLARAGSADDKVLRAVEIDLHTAFLELVASKNPGVDCCILVAKKKD